MPTGKDQVEYNRGLTRLAESARLTDDVLQEMADSSNAWRNGRNAKLERLVADAATDKALETVVAWLRNQVQTRPQHYFLLNDLAAELEAQDDT